MTNKKYDSLLDIDDVYRKSVDDLNMRLVAEDSGTHRVGLAIIGIGRMGFTHLDNALREPRINLRYILDGSKERLEFARKKYFLDDRQDINVITPDQIDLIWKDPKVEGVIICTPTVTHPTFIEAAIEHKKHILCEKPLTDNAELNLKYEKLAHKRKLTLMCALNRRFDPSIAKLHEIALRGDLGKVRTLHCVMRDSPVLDPKALAGAGGFLEDFLVHHMDLVLWTVQELPEEVYAIAIAHEPAYAEANDYDTALVTLKFPSGILASFEVSRVSTSGYDQRFEIYGPDGFVKIDESSAVAYERFDSRGLTKPSNSYSFVSKMKDSYVNELIEFVNHVEGNKTTVVFKPVYLACLSKVTAACDKSAKKMAPLKLSWTQEEMDSLKE